MIILCKPMKDSKDKQKKVGEKEQMTGGDMNTLLVDVVLNALSSILSYFHISN